MIPIAVSGLSQIFQSDYSRSRFLIVGLPEPFTITEVLGIPQKFIELFKYPP